MRILGLDVGTSSVKAAVLDQRTGEPLTLPAKAAYDLDHPSPDATEIPPQRLREALWKAAREAIQNSVDAGLGQKVEVRWLHSAKVSRALHYARWKSGRQDLEVDIVSLDPRTQKPRFAVEIKWSDRAPAALHELRGLRELAAKHRLVRKPLVTMRTYTGEAHIDGIDVEFMPVALHCYTIGRNLLRGN